MAIKKLLVFTGLILLITAGGVSASRYIGELSDRVDNVQADDAPKALEETKTVIQTDHHNPQLGPDPSELPQVDLTNMTDVYIDIKNSNYEKPNIKIKKGTRVTWVNQDNIEHNAMRSHDEEEHAHDAPEPEDIRDDLFAGPLLQKGESYSFTFTKPGKLYYHSAPHPTTVGVITVVE